MAASLTSLLPLRCARSAESSEGSASASTASTSGWPTRSSMATRTPRPPDASASWGELAAMAAWSWRSKLRLASLSRRSTAVITAWREPPGTMALAGDSGGLRRGRTSVASGDTSSLGDLESTWATAATCGWQSLRMRGKVRSVAMGTKPALSRAVSMRNLSAAILSGSR